jgi:nucleolar complex protein 3
VKGKKQLHREKQIKVNIFKQSKTAQKKDQLNGSKNGETPEKKKKNQQKPKQKQKQQNMEVKDDERILKASDMFDMMQDSSDEEVNLPKRQRLDSTSDISQGSDTEQSDNESEIEEMAEHLEMAQRKAGAMEAGAVKKMKDLLPIKTKTGVVSRQVEETKKKVQVEESESDDEEMVIEEDDSDNKDSDEELIDYRPQLNQNKQEPKKKKKMSAMELLMEREEELQRQKFRIGVICSGILEKPEEKIKNIGALLGMITQHGGNKEENMISTRKLAMISLVEVFKDIVPDYKVGVVDLEHQKVKKDTLARVTYENELLKIYRNFLKELEYITKVMKKRKFGPRPSKESVNLAIVAINCLCEMLLSQPYFNFSTNIGQLLVTFINYGNEVVRRKINETFVKLFKTDKRLDLTLHVVRHINHLVKRKSNFVHVEVISCLTHLQIKNINVNAEKEAELKQKRMEQHKSRLISLSKRERKKKKKLADLEKEMMETQAEENKQSKNSKLTEVSKLVFTIYFRILKQNPNSKLLSSALEGLAK